MEAEPARVQHIHLDRTLGGRGPDRVETLTAELGSAKAEAEKQGARLMDTLRRVEAARNGLKQEGIEVSVRMSNPAIQAAYRSAHGR